MDDPKGTLDIPEFLKRAIGKANAPSEATMSNVDVESDPTPVKAPRRKAPSKANGAAKAAKGTKQAPAKVKAASKPAKGKAAVKAKAKAKGTRKLVERDEYGYALGTLRSKAAAMYASKTGATLEEIVEKLGSVQLNLLKTLAEAGHKVTKKKEEGSGNRKVTRYFLK